MQDQVLRASRRGRCRDDSLHRGHLGVQVSPGPASDLTAIPPDPAKLKDYITRTSITLSAEVAVAIHLTVGWLVHVDWSGDWGFAETVSGSALTSVLP